MADEKTIVLKIETITDKAVMEAYGETLDTVLGSYEDNIALITQYNAQIKANKEEIKRIEAESQKWGKTTQRQSAKIARLTAENNKLTQAKAQLVQITKNQEKIDTSVAGSMENQAQLLGKLRMAWRQMTDEQKAANDGLLGTIQELDKGLKDSDAEIGNFQRNVGNYAGAIAQSLARLDILPAQIATYISAIGRLQGAYTTLSTVIGVQSVTSLKAFIASLSVAKKALLATGIGAIVVALGTIVAYWDEISNLWNSAAREAENAEKSINALNRSLEINENVATQLGTKALKEYTEALRGAEGDTEKLRPATDKYNHSVRIYALNEAKTNVVALERTQKALEDSYAKMLKGNFSADEAAEARKKIEENRKKLLVEQQKVAKIENQIELDKQKEIEDTRKAEEKAAEDRAKVREKELAEIEKYKNETHLATLTAEDRELSTLGAKYQEKLALYRKYGEDTVQLTEVYEAERAAIIKKYRDAEHGEFIKGMEEDISATNAIIEGEFATILEEIEAEIEKEWGGYKPMATFGLARALGVTDEQLMSIKDQVLSAVSSIYSSISKISQEATQRRLNDELDAIEQEAQSEKDILKSKVEKGVLLQKDYEKKLAELDKQTAERKEQANREAFEKQKAWNIGQAIMNAALAITKLFTEGTAINPATWAALAITTATTAAEIAVIATQKYARGGELKGASHAQGGIKGFVGNQHIEAEGGEVIINKRSSAKHRKLLSLINSDNGWGVDFANARGSSGRFFARGGMIGGYDFRTSPLPDTGSSLARFAQQQADNLQASIDAINRRIDNLRVSVLLSDIEAKTNEKRVHISRAVL